jgi:hypothetical protein
LLGAAVLLVSASGVGTVPAAHAAAGAAAFTCQESFPNFPGTGNGWCDGTVVSSSNVVGELDLVFAYSAANPLAVSESGSYCLEADNDEEDGGSEAEGCPNPGNFTLTQVGAVAVLSTTGTFNGSGIAVAVPLSSPLGGPATWQLTGTFAGT